MDGDNTARISSIRIWARGRMGVLQLGWQTITHGHQRRLALHPARANRQQDRPRVDARNTTDAGGLDRTQRRAGRSIFSRCGARGEPWKHSGDCRRGAAAQALGRGVDEQPDRHCIPPLPRIARRGARDTRCRRHDVVPRLCPAGAGRCHGHHLRGATDHGNHQPPQNRSLASRTHRRRLPQAARRIPANPARAGSARAIRVVDVEVDGEPNVSELKRAIRLLKRDSDALWLLNDDRLLTPQLIADAWLPGLNEKPWRPTIVGAASLVSSANSLGTFAVLPDHTALGAQAASLVFESPTAVGCSRARSPACRCPRRPRLTWRRS